MRSSTRLIVEINMNRKIHKWLKYFSLFQQYLYNQNRNLNGYKLFKNTERTKLNSLELSNDAVTFLMWGGKCSPEVVCSTPLHNIEIHIRILPLYSFELGNM